MASIDKINVNGALYYIDLPTTATPSIASLTVTGNATINGDTTIGGILSTADGATISKDLTVGGNVGCATLNCSGAATIRSINSQTLTVNNMSVRQELTANTFYCSGIVCPALKATPDAGNLTVPTTSGTLARLQDIPSVPTFSAITSNEINLMFI